MVQISPMASVVNSPAILGSQLLPHHGNKLYTSRSSSWNFITQHPEDLRRPTNMLPNSILSSSTVSSLFEKPVLINVQDSRLDSFLFSLGIADKCHAHERIIKFLMHGTNSVEREDIDISVLSELMGLKPLALVTHPQPDNCSEESFCLCDVEIDDSQQVLIPKKHLFVPDPEWNCFGKFTPTLITTDRPDGRLIFVNTEVDTKDIPKVVDEFRISKPTRSMLVPYFTRRRSKAKNQASSKLEAQVVSPPKSSGDITLKPANKRRNKKAVHQRDLYQRNYLHAWESLLSFVLDRNKDSTAIVLLKKSSPEISQLLTKISAGIAGTGLAIIFSIFYKSGYGKVPLCSFRLLDMGLGVALFWLSLAVSKLRDTIMMINKISSKQKLNDEELAGKVDKIVKEIVFRAAAIVAVGILRLA